MRALPSPSIMEARKVHSKGALTPFMMFLAIWSTFQRNLEHKPMHGPVRACVKKTLSSSWGHQGAGGC